MPSLVSKEHSNICQKRLMDKLTHRKACDWYPPRKALRKENNSMNSHYLVSKAKKVI